MKDNWEAIIYMPGDTSLPCARDAGSHPASQRLLPAVLLRVLLHPRLQLGAEVADEALDGPSKGLAESCKKVSKVNT